MFHISDLSPCGLMHHDQEAERALVGIVLPHWNERFCEREAKIRLRGVRLTELCLGSGNPFGDDP